MPIVTNISYKIREGKYNECSERIQLAKEEQNEAKSQGDLRENPGYIAAREQIAINQRMQSKLEFFTPNLQIVDPKIWTEDTEIPSHVQLGKKVTLLLNGIKETLFIGGAWDSDLENPKVVAYTSPLAKAIMGKEPNTKTTLPTNNSKIEVLRIENPTLSEIETLYFSPKKEKKTEVSPNKPTQNQNTLDIL